MAEKLNFTVDLEDGVFVARCIELDITTDGLTKAEAVENLKEALDCYFANPDERLERRLGRVRPFRRELVHEGLLVSGERGAEAGLQGVHPQ